MHFFVVHDAAYESLLRGPCPAPRWPAGPTCRKGFRVPSLTPSEIVANRSQIRGCHSACMYKPSVPNIIYHLTTCRSSPSACDSSGDSSSDSGSDSADSVATAFPRQHHHQKGAAPQPAEPATALLYSRQQPRQEQSFQQQPLQQQQQQPQSPPDLSSLCFEARDTSSLLTNASFACRCEPLTGNMRYRKIKDINRCVLATPLALAMPSA